MNAILQHVVVLRVIAERRAVQDQRERHRSRPQSSSASRFTASAAGFFIFSQSRERRAEPLPRHQLSCIALRCQYPAFLGQAESQNERLWNRSQKDQFGLISGCRRASQEGAGAGSTPVRVVRLSDMRTACVRLSALPVPCLLGDAALAQFVLLHLAALRGR